MWRRTLSSVVLKEITGDLAPLFQRKTPLRAEEIKEYPELFAGYVTLDRLKKATNRNSTRLNNLIWSMNREGCFAKHSMRLLSSELGGVRIKQLIPLSPLLDELEPFWGNGWASRAREAQQLIRSAMGIVEERSERRLRASVRQCNLMASNRGKVEELMGLPAIKIRKRLIKVKETFIRMLPSGNGGPAA